MTRGFYLINFLPLINAVIPSNIMISNSILSSALNLDIIAFIKPWELGLIEFDEDGETAAIELF